MVYSTHNYIYFQANGKMVHIYHGLDNSVAKITFSQNEDYVKLETSINSVHLYRFPTDEELIKDDLDLFQKWDDGQTLTGSFI